MQNFEHWEDAVFALNVEPTSGSLLLANPFLLDPHFKRAVVLLTQHSGEGTVGFILNKPFNIPLTQMTDAFYDMEAPLFFGGPVRLDTLHFIHKIGTALTDSQPVKNRTYWGGEIEALKELILLGLLKTEDIRFFIGYSGWGAGQLAEELEQKSWIVVPYTDEWVWQLPNDNLWRDILKSMGEPYAYLANFPEDPRLN